jgi:hypothetical protein
MVKCLFVLLVPAGLLLVLQPSALLAQGISAQSTITTTTQRDTTLAAGVVLTPTQADALYRDQARVWGITVDEYKRYEQLMKGMRGRLSSPHITPYEVLGIHAENDADRMKWARRFAQAIAEDTQKILAYESAYHEAFRSLYPGMTPFKDGTPFMVGGELAPKPTARQGNGVPAPRGSR